MPDDDAVGGGEDSDILQKDVPEKRVMEQNVVVVVEKCRRKGVKIFMRVNPGMTAGTIEKRGIE